MLLALALEAALVAVGLYLFISGGKIGGRRAISLAVPSVLVLGFTALGMTVAPPPPSGTAMAASSLVTLSALCALAYWFGSPPLQASHSLEGP
jgi:hypothetical protein